MEQETCQHLVDSIVSGCLWLMDVSTETIVTSLHHSRDLVDLCADMPFILGDFMSIGEKFQAYSKQKAAMLHRSVKLCSLLSLLCNVRARVCKACSAEEGVAAAEKRTGAALGRGAGADACGHTGAAAQSGSCAGFPHRA